MSYEKTPNNYWDKTGKYQKHFNDLSEKLIPSKGKADTVAGELLRAVNKIYYDAYNNGVGCNDMRSFVNYLHEGHKIFADFAEYRNAYNFACFDDHNEDWWGDRDDYGSIEYILTEKQEEEYRLYLDTLVDKVYENIRDNPKLRKTPNTVDSLNYSVEELDDV